MLISSKCLHWTCAKLKEATISSRWNSCLFTNSVLRANWATRFFSDKFDDRDDSVPVKTVSDKSNRDFTQIEMNSKYKIFQDSDAPILLDVYEEKMQLEQINLSRPDEEMQEEFLGINLERGVRGVFDIEDLVELLRRDKAEDMFVAELPAEASYVDYIVIVNGRSKRHMTALGEIVRRVYKKKRFSTDILPRIEGEGSSDWMALDLGNIALHIFSQEARNIYDLESLWSVGPEYDPLANSPDDALTAIMKEHSISFNDFQNKPQLL